MEQGLVFTAAMKELTTKKHMSSLRGKFAKLPEDIDDTTKYKNSNDNFVVNMRT